ncbi:hypothetical protein HDU76_000482 [Blyttiomyces sp. JEL0837]|nr:hypothetical protein HDU76_000482 [Blyttiomyces sp. JEL0837]
MEDDEPMMMDDGDATQPDSSFAGKLDLFPKIRTQANSGLANQRKAALLLLAVEKTITEQNEELSPLAYFGALMNLLEQQVSRDVEEEQEALVTSIAHLLSAVFPRIPTNLLRLKFSAVATTLTSAIHAHHSAAPIVRDLTVCVEVLLLAQDLATWNAATANVVVASGRGSETRSLFLLLLILSIDERPKVRKRAQDGIKRLLSRPPPPSLYHPASIPTLDFCIQQITDFQATAGSGNAKAREAKETGLLHVLGFLKSLLPVVAIQGTHDKIRSKLKTLSESLLKIPVKSSGSGNMVLTSWIYQVMDSLFGTPVKSSQDNPFPHLSVEIVDPILRSILTTKPYMNDLELAPAWLDLVGRGFLCLAKLIEMNVVEDRSYGVTAYPELVCLFWKTYFAAVFAKDIREVIRFRAGEVFANIIKEGIPTAMLQVSVKRDSKKNFVLEILESVKSALSNIHFMGALKSIYLIAEASFRFGADYPGLVDGILGAIIEVRDSEAFAEAYPYKVEVESALEAAAQAMGFERFTLVEPLNIFDVEETETRRPYLLTTFVNALKRPALQSIATGDANKQFGPPNLSYFTVSLLPLYERLVDRSKELKTQNLANPAKLFQTLAHQTFSIFPAICDTVPSDLPDCFQHLAKGLAKLIQAEKTEGDEDELMDTVKSMIYAGLQSLVKGYQKIAKELNSSDDEEESEQPELLEIAASGMNKLQSHSTKFLSVLCNNFTTPSVEVLKLGESKANMLQGLHERGQMVLENCIAAFLSIAEPKAISGYFFSLVKGVLQIQTSLANTSADAGETEVKEWALQRLRMYSMLDLLNTLLPYLPEVRARLEGDESAVPESLPADSPLFMYYKVLSGQLRDTDATLQKKTYRSLNNLMAALPVAEAPLKDLMPKIIDPEVIANTTSGAKRPRILLMQTVVDLVGAEGRPEETSESEAMLVEFVPVALSEIMLATKEASEKARTAAYECLISMGGKMLAFGIKTARDAQWEKTRAKLSGLAVTEEKMGTEGGDCGRNISLKEFIMMVAAGLAGESTHMQSATISCLGRLLFEFNDSLEVSVLKEVISTVLMFMTSNNREILKACFGFIKVVVVSVRQEYLEDDLENIITSLFSLNRDNKGHFKSKIRHILERLIRRFSLEAVQGFVPESDSKLITNIRKRRERLKKKKMTERSTEEGDDEDDPVKAVLKSKTLMKSRQKEYEDAVHESESELGESDDDQYIPEQLQPVVSRTNRKQAGNRSVIREDEDIVDFLDSNVVSRVTTSGPSGQSKKRSASRDDDFTFGDDGRMIVDEEGDGTQAAADSGAAENPENIYLDALKGEVAFERGPNGKVKFLKRKNMEEANEDGETTTGHRWGGKFGSQKSSKNQGMDESAKAKLLGRQYQSKRAKGDVKKSNMPDPYAYIPMSGKIVGNMKKSTQLSTDMKDLIKATKKGGDIKARKEFARSSGLKKGNKKHK